jgi:omega-6 fatty acid desaturase (delta-12 desaturase)
LPPVWTNTQFRRKFLPDIIPERLYQTSFLAVYNQVPETIAQVKAHVPESLRKRSLWIAPLLFLLSAACYTATFAITLSPLPIWLRLVASLLNAVFIATLFIVGHDACHGSLTPKSWLNKLIGRLAFLP